MSLKLAARLVALDVSKIADLQENDTATHILDLRSFVPPECIAILFSANRKAGSGVFRIYPRSSPSNYFLTSSNIQVLTTIKDQELKWQNTVANDDWDLYLIGYFVQKRIR